MLVDYSLDENWGINAGYFYLVRPTRDGPDLTSQFLRAGLTYRKDFGRFTFDDRLLYEAVLNGQGRDNGNRLRNRARLTYNLPPASRAQPRIFSFVEPIYDDRFGGISRFDVAVGGGATIAGAWRADVYLLRQANRGASRSDAKAVVVQFIVDLSALHR